jgi:FKBP-type peptidyl-prolyl cis-trans isomerase (trigger factor)
MMEKKFLEGELKVQIAEENGCRRVISVEIAPERFKGERSRVLKEMVKEVALPGFRKGKVPVDIVEKRFEGEIRAEAIRSILPDAYEHIVAENGLEPVGDPEFRDVKAAGDEPLSFNVCIEVFPRFEIEEYRDIKVTADDPVVTDEEVQEVIANLRERSADFIKVDRAAAAGDVVTLDFTPIGPDGTVDVKSRVNNYPVELGSGQIFPAFEEAIVGKRVGESGNVDVEYPADYKPERLAGKKIAYEFTVNDVREKQIPPLDDAFAAKVDAKFKTLDELRADVRGRLIEEKTKEERRKREERARGGRRRARGGRGEAETDRRVLRSRRAQEHKTLLRDGAHRRARARGSLGRGYGEGVPTDRRRERTAGRGRQEAVHERPGAYRESQEQAAGTEDLRDHSRRRLNRP